MDLMPQMYELFLEYSNKRGIIFKMKAVKLTASSYYVKFILLQFSKRNVRHQHLLL